MSDYPSATSVLDWHVSRACESGACIKVARDGDFVIFGNTTAPKGNTYSYTVTEWKQFVIGVKQGDFDNVA